MPANDKYPAWAIHIDLVEGVREKLGQYCASLPALVCVEENGEETGKPHVHILTVLTAPESKQTLGNRLKKIFPVFGAQFSFVPWVDYESDSNFKVQQYTCKGPSKSVKTPPIVLYKNWLDDVMIHHENYWTRADQIARENKDKVKKGTVNDDMVTAIIEEIKNEKVDANSVFQVACSKVVKWKKGKINDHVAWPLIQSIDYHFNPSEVSSAFYYRMLKKKQST